MSKWEANVRRVMPYVPGEQPRDASVIKLNTNENPYPPTPKVQEVLNSFDAGQLRLYPDPAAAELVEAIAAYCHVGKEQVFVGVGSDDVLAMSFLTFFNSAKPILFPDITYSFYDVWAKMLGIPYQTRPLNEHLEIDPEDYMADNGGIVLANPNAPTGVEASGEMLEKIVAGNPDSVVIIDEAYVDFGAASMLPLVNRYDNLLVVQTFSKSRSLAGSRIGFAVGDSRLINYLNDVKYSFNSYTMDRLTILVGKAAVEDDAYFREQTKKIIETREWVKGELRALGFTFPDSAANFLFVSHESVSAKQIFEALRRHRIYVRYFARPRIDDCLRITIGTREEMEALLTFLRSYLA